MILWTLGLVLTLGWVTGSLMLQPPRSVNSATSLPAIRLATTDKNARQPASVKKDLSGSVKAASLGEMVSNEPQATELELDCQGSKETSYSRGVAQVRLTGKSCTKGSEILSTEVRNEANGFSATIFHQGKNLFLTDYITLARGENRIRILHVLKKGGREEREHLIKVSF